jgi:uncharacterized protein
MKPRVSMITLAVNDLKKSFAFYHDGLGWPSEGIVGTKFEHGAVAFFELQNGLKLALWGHEDLLHDTGLAKTPRSPSELTLGHNVNSAQEVDEIMERVRNAGGNIIKPASKTFWGGYSTYFQDPDGHVWEVAWNPQWVVKD